MNRNKDRIRLKKTYGHLYDWHFSSRTGCFYCGDLAGTVDHCPPLSFCDSKDNKWFNNKKIKLLKVRACINCNMMLGDRPLLTLMDRADYVRRKLELKAEKAIIWTKDEINEMSAMFQKMINGKKTQQDILLQRIRFAQQLAYRCEDFPESMEH